MANRRGVQKNFTNKIFLKINPTLRRTTVRQKRFLRKKIFFYKKLFIRTYWVDIKSWWLPNKNIFSSWFASGKLFLNNGFEEKQGNNIFIIYQRFSYFKYFKRVGKKKGGRTRKRKEDKTQLFKSLQSKIGIEQEEFDTQYEDFMNICPKVNIFKNEKKLNKIF